jgi:hypothetical protein
MGSSTTYSQKPAGQRGESLVRNVYVELAWASILAGLVAGLYFTAAGITLWISAILLAAMLFLPTRSIRLQAVDWSVLLLCAFEIPSLLFSQYRANSIRAAVAIAVFALTYYAARLAIRASPQIVSFSGLLGLGGGYLALSGLSQFDENVNRLGSVGLTKLVAFRSRLISPTSPWIPGEWFTLLLLALPFA